MIMVDTVRITKVFYDTLTPFEQGYASYFQAEWPGSEIPRSNPYPVGTTEHGEWIKGAQQAVIAVIDVEE